MSRAKATESIKTFYDDITKAFAGYYDITPLAKKVMLRLKEFSAEEFKDFIDKLAKDEIYLPLIIPTLTGKRPPIEKLMKIAEQYGGDPFGQLRRADPITGLTYITPESYWVGLFPERRQIQTIASKKSMPDDNKTIDSATGQVTGPSKGSSISTVQAVSVLAKGMEANAIELVKARGGDNVAAASMTKSIVETGGVSIKTILDGDSEVESKKTLSSKLNTIHIQHNL